MRINQISSNKRSNNAVFGHHFYKQTQLAKNDLPKEFKDAVDCLKGEKRTKLIKAMDYFEKHTFDADVLIEAYSKIIKSFKNRKLMQEWNELVEPYANANEISGSIGIRHGYNCMGDDFNTTLHVKDEILGISINKPNVTKPESLYKLAFDIDNAVYNDITKKFKTIQQKAIEAEKESHEK